MMTATMVVAICPAGSGDILLCPCSVDHDKLYGIRATLMDCTIAHFIADPKAKQLIAEWTDAIISFKWLLVFE